MALHPAVQATATGRGGAAGAHAVRSLVRPLPRPAPLHGGATVPRDEVGRAEPGRGAGEAGVALHRAGGRRLRCTRGRAHLAAVRGRRQHQRPGQRRRQCEPRLPGASRRRSARLQLRLCASLQHSLRAARALRRQPRTPLPRLPVQHAAAPSERAEHARHRALLHRRRLRRGGPQPATEGGRGGNTDAHPRLRGRGHRGAAPGPQPAEHAALHRRPRVAVTLVQAPQSRAPRAALRVHAERRRRGRRSRLRAQRRWRVGGRWGPGRCTPDRARQCRRCDRRRGHPAPPQPSWPRHAAAAAQSPPRGCVLAAAGDRQGVLRLRRGHGHPARGVCARGSHGAARERPRGGHPRGRAAGGAGCRAYVCCPCCCTVASPRLPGCRSPRPRPAPRLRRALPHRRRAHAARGSAAGADGRGVRAAAAQQPRAVRRGRPGGRGRRLPLCGAVRRASGPREADQRRCRRAQGPGGEGEHKRPA